MNARLIVPVVEGHGEVQAVPVLIRRIFSHYRGDVFPEINPPIRVKSGSFLNDPDYFRRYVALAAAKAVQGDGTVLVLLDCEDDCAGTLGPKLLSDAQAVRADAAYLVALAHREYETWFIAAAASLALPHQADPESIRGAKEWIARHIPGGYDPIQHQTSMTAGFDLSAARSVPSFDRLCRKLTV